MSQGDVYSFTFTETGEFPYFCRFHGDAGDVGMIGTILVRSSRGGAAGRPAPTPTPATTAPTVVPGQPTPTSLSAGAVATSTPTPSAAIPACTPTPTAVPIGTPRASPTPSQADELTLALAPSKDNTLYRNGGAALSNATGEHHFVGNNNRGYSRRAIIAFDVTGQVPAGATITGVTLTLSVSRTQAEAQIVAVHRLLADWGEGSSKATRGEGGGRRRDFRRCHVGAPAF